MVPSGKWIDGIRADGSVVDTARRSLEARLLTVNHWLPLAAYLAGQDVEHVHRLRVSTRRAVAALDLYRDWLPRKSARRLAKRLKKIRRAAGDARDLDVLAHRLASDYGERAAAVVTMIAARRAAVQPAIVAVAERSRRKDRLVRKTGKLLAGIRPPNPPAEAPTFRAWATEPLADAAKQFFTSMPDPSADTAALHQFRILGKRLRYTIELVAPAFGRPLRRDHYPVVEELQECLGKIQDHVTAAEWLREEAVKETDESQQELLLELAAEEETRLEDQRRDFHEWWTAERADALRQGLMPAENHESPTPLPQAAVQM